MGSTTISTGRDVINGQKKGGVKAHTVIRADEDVPFFVNITDAAVSDQSLFNYCYKNPPERFVRGMI